MNIVETDETFRRVQQGDESWKTRLPVDLAYSPVQPLLLALSISPILLLSNSTSSYRSRAPCNEQFAVGFLYEING